MTLTAKKKAAINDPGINVALSEMRDMVGALSDQSKQDIVFFSSVASDLRKTTEMLVTESQALKDKCKEQQLSIDHLERALSTQQQQNASLNEQLSNLGAAHSALEVAQSRNEHASANTHRAQSASVPTPSLASSRSIGTRRLSSSPSCLISHRTEAF